MKSLFLMRHAKSSWANPLLDDKERQLSRRGLRDAPVMGERFNQRGEELELVLASPATRALVTAELFTQAAEIPSELISKEDDLYFSSRSSIEDIVRGQDSQVESLMLVFHNPAITEFVKTINAADRIGNIPTCGLVKLASDINHWQDWSIENTEFIYFDYPKKDLV